MIPESAHWFRAAADSILSAMPANRTVTKIAVHMEHLVLYCMERQRVVLENVWQAHVIAIIIKMLKERGVNRIRLWIAAQVMRNVMSSMQTIHAVLQAFAAIHAIMAITTLVAAVNRMNAQMAQSVVMV